MRLNDEQKKKVISLARNTIADRLGIPYSAPDIDKNEDFFREKRGVFVTLNKYGSLRGCIGYIAAVKPLAEAVTEMAQAAAFSDPRFQSLTPEEFDAIDIEISVLSPVEKVSDIEEIEVGRDGLIISLGSRSGLLLPQVATEHKWNKIQFLEHTCYKAGLPGDSWQSPEVKIEKFSADIFGEKSRDGEPSA